jgi:hypothetical protein
VAQLREFWGLSFIFFSVFLACVQLFSLKGLMAPFSLSAGYWLLAIGYWLLAIGYWLLAIGYWLFHTV